MSDSAETASFDAVPEEPGQPVSASASPSWAADSGGSAGGSASGAAAERPEMLVGAAFVGGLLLATILKRLAS